MDLDKKPGAKTRNSGIELLKIAAIVLIVISHVVQTLRSANPYVPSGSYVIDLSVATVDPHKFLLMLFSYFGHWGNTVFFICSAWFLLDSAKWNKRKWFFMLSEIWFVSMVILAVTMILRQGDVARVMILRSFLPTTLANNWYLTCYLLFYPIHPYLNTVIRKLDKQGLFRCSAALFVLYFGFAFIKRDLFFSSNLVLWIAIYFVMAYIKLYAPEFAASTKGNIILLLIGFAGYVGIAAAANAAGLHISALNDKVLHWATNYNPFLVAMSVALFNLARKLTFKNKAINYLSGLSLLVYIIHENLILRMYYRPALWDLVYRSFGHRHVAAWTLALSLLVFAFGLISAAIYDVSLRRLVRKAANGVFSLARTVYLKAEARLLKPR